MTADKEFKVNDYITLKLEKGKTIIYIKGKEFKSCKYLLMNINTSEVEKYDYIESVDEAAAKLSNKHEFDKSAISPEDEFWGHCSNLEAWAENDYNTKIISSDLAFPLLKKLAEVGDEKATRVFKEEIAKRFRSGYEPTQEYLIKEGYLDYLTPEELEVVMKGSGPDELIKLIQKGYLTALKLLNDSDLARIKGIVLNDRDLSSLPESISKLKNLERLNLKRNSLSSLPESISELRNLKELELDNNKLSSLIHEPEGKFPPIICELTSLRKLSLSYNRIITVRKSISNLGNLERLDLSNNRISSLPESIKDLRNLRALNLSNNAFAQFPLIICQLISLEKLKLDHNKIPPVPECIGKLKNLKELNLSHNNISSLPDGFGNLTSLEELKLAFNPLSSLPDGFGNLRSLKRLILVKSQISSLPDGFSNLENLETVQLLNTRRGKDLGRRIKKKLPDCEVHYY